LADFQEQAKARVEGMGRIRNAEVDLDARIEELRALAADEASQLEQGREHQRRLAALVEREKGKL